MLTAIVIAPAAVWVVALLVMIVQLIEQALAVRHHRKSRLAWGPWRASTQGDRIATLVWLCVGLAVFAVGFALSLR